LSEGGPLFVKLITSWHTSFRVASFGSSGLAASWPSLWVSKGEDKVVFEELDGLVAYIASTSASNEAVIRTDSGAA